MGSRHQWRAAVQKYLQQGTGTKARRSGLAARSLAMEPLECRRLLDAAGVHQDTADYATSIADVTAGTATKLIVTAQAPASVTAGTGFTLTVSAEDADGNVDTTFNGSVAVAIANNPAAGTLSGTTTVTAVSGVATFSGLSLDKAGTGYTLSLSSGALTSATTDGINVTPAAATQLVVTMQPPASVVSATQFPVTVSAEDSFGNVDPTFTGTVTMAILNNPGNSTLKGQTSVVAAGGVAAFSNLTLEKVGSGYTLQATATGLSAAVTDGFAITARAATQLLVSSQPPASVAAGQPFDVKIAAKDGFGNVDPNFTGNVTIALDANPGGSTLGGTLTVAAVAGIADFSTLTLDKIGTGYTLTATNNTITPTTTHTFNVTVGQATKLAVVTQPPSSVVSGAAFDVKISAVDANGDVDTNYTGNITIALGANPGSATLGGTTTVAAVAGVADFGNLTLDKAGTGYTLSATSAALTPIVTSALDVTPGVATQLVVTTAPPANVTVGSTFGLSVSAEDAAGNVDPTFTGNVTMAILNNPTTATLHGTLTVAAVNGVATFTDLNLDEVGTGYTLSATGASLTAGATPAFNVTPIGIATHLDVTAQPPATETAGQAFSVSISARDDQGNVDTTFTGNVTIALANNPGSATLGGTLTVAAVNGVATFSDLTLDKVGTGYTLTATNATLVSATTAGMDVTAAAATHLVVSQLPASVVSGSPFDVQISAEDQFGNVDTSFTGSVVVALAANPGGSTLGGTTTVNAVAGVADFSTLTLNKAATGYTLQATSSITSVTTDTFDVTPGAATKLVTAAAEQDEVAGQPFAINVILVEDANDNVVTTFTGNVTVALLNNPTGATLGGTTTLPVTNGTATFTDLTIDKVGSGYTLQATSTGLASVTAGPINIAAGVASQLQVTTQPPASVTAGTPFSVQISATDAGGNVDTSFTGNITIALGNNPGNATLGGTLTVAAVAGVATFSDLTLDKVGTGYTLSVTSGALAGATTAAVDVVAATATQLAVATQPPASVSVDTPFDVTISATDANGNVDTSFTGPITIALANNPSGATLGGTLTVNAVAGVADFGDLTIDQLGTGYTLAASGTGLTGVTTAALNVVTAAATKLQVSEQPPATVTAGGNFGVQISVTDANGNVDTSYSGNVTIALGANPAGGTLSGTLTVAAVDGIASFTGLSLDKAGTGYTIVASSAALTGITTNDIAVTPAAATKLVVTTVPATVTAGTDFDVKVSAEDSLGNVDTSFTGAMTIALANNPTGDTLGGTLTVNAVNGVADFGDLKLTKAGTGYTLQATSTSLTLGTSTAFDVTAAAASQFVITTTPPANVTASAPFSVAVTAEDQFGNVDTSFTGNVTVSLGANPGSSTLGGTLTVAAAAGVATFSDLTLNNVGTGYTLSLAGGALPSVTTNAFNVTAAGAATQLAVTSEPPASVTAGASFGLTVTAEDSLGNIDTSFNGTVTIALGNNPGSATLGGTLTVTAVNGVATFTGLTLNKAATGYTLVVTHSGLTSATTSAVSVTAAAATQLAVTLQSSTTFAGDTFDIHISAEDQFGNVDTSFTGSVSVALANNPGGSTLGGTTAVTAVNGLADFSTLTLNKVGSGYTLTASSGSLTSATTGPIAVVANAATQLVVTTQPPATVGPSSPFDVKISVEDAQGNVVTNFSGNVTIALANNPGGATLGGTTTVAVTNGVADFSTLTLDKVGTGYTLTASSSTLTSATTTSFNVGNTATKLVVTTQPPSSAAAGATFTVAVSAEDANGNVDTSYNGSVTIALGANPGGSTLGGTLTVTAVNGVATFSNLTLNKVGTGYTLTTTSGTLTSTTTNTLNIVAAAATQLVITTQPPSSVAAGGAFGLTITAEDANGNVATSYSGSVTVALASNPSSGTLSGTTTVTVVNGVATFSGLSINNSGSGYTLTATSGSLTAATSNAITVTLIAANGSISGTVYADIDNSGTLSATDPLLSGVVITLTGTTTSGNTITPLVLKSDANGKFTFGSLLPGTYTLTKTQPSSLLDGAPTAGSLGGSVASNEVISNIVVTQGATGTGYFFDMGGLQPTVITINDFLSTTPSGTTVLNSFIGSSTPTTGTQLVITMQPPSSVAAGGPFRVQVAVEDAQGFLATNYNGTVTLTLANNPGGANLGGTTTVNVTNGIADFSTLTLSAAGSGYTLTATSGGLSSATTSGITVNATQATHLVISTQPPSSVGVNNTFDVKVSVQDAQGNVVTGFTGNVTVALANNPGSATLGGTTTVAVTNGVADFSTLTLNQPGTGYTIIATSGSLTSATTTAFNVVSVSATQVVVTTQPPSNVAAGNTFEVKVAVEDSSGNVDTSYSGNVTIALGANPGSSTLGGTLTLAVTNGVADFTNLTLNKSGSAYTLTASSGSLTAATTNTFDVVAGAATQLVVVTQPSSSVTAGSAFDTQVAVEDAQGNVANSFSGSVTIALAANPGGATLGGTLTVTVVNGLADFSTLTLNKAGTGYTLTATSGALTAATTNSFNVTPGAATQLAVTTQPPATTTVGSPFGLAVSVEDANGNVVTGFSGNVAVALGNNPGGATLGGTTSIAVTSGVATFSDLTLDKVGTGYTLSATSGTLAAATTSAIDVTGATKLAVTTQPPASVTAGATFDVQISAEDSSGDVATDFNGPVTISLGSNPSGGTLGGTLTVNAVNGVADFSNLTLDKVGIGYTLSATSGSLTAITSNALNVVAGAAANLAVVTQPPANVAVGAPFETKISITDAEGNVDTTFNGNVTIALANNPSSANLGGTLTIAAVNGVADFTDLTLDKTGTGYTLTATSGALTSVTTSALNVVTSTATQLAITTQPPTSVAAGATFGLVVSAEDASGVVDSSFNGQVTLILANNPSGATLGGTLVATAVNGVATFSGLTLDKIGTGYTITASSGTLTSATTNDVDVVASSATQLAITTQPPTSIAVGATFGFVVSAEDGSGDVDSTFNGLVTIALANNPGGATLSGTLTATAVNGVATFSGLTLDKIGTGYTITASSGTLTSATTNDVDVVASSATQLAITTQPPTSIAVGATFGLVVSAEDAGGDVDSSFNGLVTIALANNPGGATLGGTLTATAVNGVATFSGLSLDKIGTGYTITATSGSLTSATTNNVDVVAGVATQLAVTAQPPANVTTGGSFGLTISAEDADGNVDLTYNGDVTIALANNPGSATLSGTLTVTAVNGVATFTGLSLDKAGTGYTLSASSGALTAATTSAFNVTAAAKLAVTTQPPGTVTAGNPFTLQVTAEDDSGDIVTDFNGAVTIALAANPGGATLGGTLTVTAVNGVASFSDLTLDKVGTGYTLTVTSGALTAATTNSLDVTPGAAANLAVTTQPPASVAAGAPFETKINVTDAEGNLDTAFTGNVTIALAANPGGATLGGTLTVAAVAGVADFTGLTLDKVGQGYTLTATSGALTAITTDAIGVVAATATQLAVKTQPPVTVTAGIVFDVQISATDAQGNVDTTFTGPVTIAIGSGPSGANLGGTLTVNAVAGVADFSDLTLDKAGTGYTLTATSGALTNITTNSLAVVAGADAKVVVSVDPPASVTAGEQFATEFAVTDAEGNLDTSFSGAVTVALGNNPGGATLGGTLTVVADGGIARFNGLTLDKVGTGYTLTATSGALTPATTAAFNVVAGADAKLAVVTQPPATVTVGAPFSTQISVTDAEGNVDTSFTGNVTIALGANPGGATLGGTLSVAAVAGIASFNDLTLDKAGTGYTLSASSGALTGITTSTFDATAAATKLLVATQPAASTTAGAPFSTSISVTDADGNVVTSYNGNVTIALANDPNGATLSGTLTVAAVNGVANFMDLSMTKAGDGYTLAVTSGALTGATTNAFSIVAADATQLSVTGQPPASVAADTSFNVQATALDQFGNVATAFTGNVVIAIASGTGTLGGTTTVAAVAGVVNFNGLTITQAGNYTLGITSGSLTPATTSQFTITPAASQGSSQATVANLVDQAISDEDTWTPVSLFD